MTGDRPDYVRGMERLVSAVQELSLARDLDSVIRTVRRVAREICGADGATFVLRDDDKCFYVDEDAIEPLWKGKRFPIDACVSGWAMTHREPVAIEDIYADPRVPADAYRATFVKSLAMVPIRRSSPIGAIGNYWAERRRVNDDELRLLSALADSTSVAMENVQLISELDARVRARTAELEAFSYSVSHDLRAPLRAIDGFGRALEEDLAGDLREETRGHLGRIRGATHRMNALIDAMLALARISRVELHDERVDVTAIARAVGDDLVSQHPERRIVLEIAPELVAQGDRSLVRIALENLLGNAVKFTARVDPAHIVVGASSDSGETIFFVRDDGAGFDPKHADRLFAPFQRLHADRDFAGTGVGLATVQRVVERHGGRLWAESRPLAGATFFFTLAPQRGVARRQG